MSEAVLDFLEADRSHNRGNVLCERVIVHPHHPLKLKPFEPALGDGPDVLNAVVPGAVGLVPQEVEVALLGALLGDQGLVDAAIVEHNRDF